METLWQDVKYGARTLAKSPGFTATAVLTLALGIGATTAIFTVVDSVLFRPLPFQDSDQLAYVLRAHPEGRYYMPRLPLQMISEWRERTEIFAGIEASDSNSVATTAGAEPERITGARVSVGTFSLLGVRPILGRVFDPEEAEAGSKVVLLSHRFWHSAFGASPAAIGKTIDLDEHTYTVIGVMPPDFRYPMNSVVLWTPLKMSGPAPQGGYGVVARLAPGVTAAQAQERANVISAALDQEKPIPDGWKLWVNPMEARRANRTTENALLLMLGAVAFVLLIACANAANLMLSRAVSRERETAVRAALGASRVQLLRRSLAESLLLSSLGGAAGVLLALWLTEVILQLVPRSVTFLTLGDIGLDYRVLLFTLGVSLATGVLFGLIPAVRAMRVDVQEALRAASRGATGSKRHSWLHGALVAVQVCLCVVLLAGAGLLLNSLVRMYRVEPGFDTENLVAMHVSLPKWRYPDAAAQGEFFEQLLARVRSMPGADSATIAGGIPPGSTGITFSLEVQREGADKVYSSQDLIVPWNTVRDDYFRVMRQPLRQGRHFTPEDSEAPEPVIAINEGMARELWPAGDAVGSRLRLNKDGKWLRVVGVVADVYQFQAMNPPSSWALYYPAKRRDLSHQKTLIVRTRGNPSAMIPLLKQQVWAVDPALPITQINTVREMYGDFFGEQRFYFTLLVSYAGVALLLSGLGIYGVVSYAVAQRTPEFGVRIALGARAGNILSLVFRRAALMVTGGLAAGVIGAVWVTRYLKALLFEVQPADALTFALVVCTLALIAAVACLVPARRATKVDPMVALRYE